MAITIMGKTYRNLQQQVLWLTKKVAEIAGGGDTNKIVTDIDFPYGDATVSYDTTDGITITGTAKIKYSDGSTVNAMADVEIPVVPGAGISMDADATGKKVIIKATEADYVSITLPASATSGTITADQLAILQGSDTAHIIINEHELYYLANKNTVNGIFTYTNNGYNEEGIQKYFNLTVSTRAFTITEERSTVEYVDITSATGTINANDMDVLTDPMGLNCARYNGYILRFVRKIDSGNGVYYFGGLYQTTSYTLSITKDSTGAGIYVINTYDLSDGGGAAEGVIPVVTSIDDPTSTSPTFVQYNGAIYALVEE